MFLRKKDKKKSEESKTSKVRSLSRLRLVFYAIGMFVWLVVALFLSRQWINLAIYILGESANLPVLRLLLQAFEYILNACIFIMVPTMVVMIVRDMSWSDTWKKLRKNLGLMKAPTWTDVGLGILGVGITLLLAKITTLFIGENISWLNMTEVQKLGPGVTAVGIEIPLVFLVVVILAPIVEELIFRGWMYGKLTNTGKTKSLVWPIVIISVLFGLVHGQVNIAIVMIVMSGIMCGLRYHTGTIWAGIFLHIFKNGIALISLLLF